MDERVYQRSREAINPSPCVFGKAILAGCAQCELSRRRALAEREVVACGFEVARVNCTTLNNLFHERATFALRLPRPGTPLPHARMMQLQCGGLKGLQAALSDGPPDVHAMVHRAQASGASLLDLNWAAIVAAIVAWQPRRRSSAPRELPD